MLVVVTTTTSIMGKMMTFRGTTMTDVAVIKIIRGTTPTEAGASTIDAAGSKPDAATSKPDAATSKSDAATSKTEAAVSTNETATPRTAPSPVTSVQTGKACAVGPYNGQTAKEICPRVPTMMCLLIFTEILLMSSAPIAPNRSGPARSSRGITTRALAAACLTAGVVMVVGMGGCYSEGGPGYSAGQHAYVSTSWQPKTVTLRDTRTGEAFWSIDVPVGKKLVVQFKENAAENGQTFGDATPDLMLWDLMAPDEDFGPLGNKIPVPPKQARRLDLTLRATPELPETMGGGVGGSKTSADAMGK